MTIKYIKHAVVIQYQEYYSNRKKLSSKSDSKKTDFPDSFKFMKSGRRVVYSLWKDE